MQLRTGSPYRPLRPRRGHFGHPAAANELYTYLRSVAVAPDGTSKLQSAILSNLPTSVELGHLASSATLRNCPASNVDGWVSKFLLSEDMRLSNGKMQFVLLRFLKLRSDLIQTWFRGTRFVEISP